MALQASAHGSHAGGTSQGASANASPNVSGKKRRASTVKVEGDVQDGAGEAGPGNKVKPSPRTNGGKRIKS